MFLGEFEYSADVAWVSLFAFPKGRRMEHVLRHIQVKSICRRHPRKGLDEGVSV